MNAEARDLRARPSGALVQAKDNLAAAAPRRRFVDLVLVAVTIGVWVVATLAFYLLLIAPSGSSWMEQFAFTCFGAGFAGYLLLLGGRGPATWAMRRFAPTWVIVDDDDGVVKVVGSVDMSDWDHAAARMLTIRPGLVRVWSAPELYGVPMAARAQGLAKGMSETA